MLEDKRRKKLIERGRGFGSWELPKGEFNEKQDILRPTDTDLDLKLNLDLSSVFFF